MRASLLFALLACGNGTAPSATPLPAPSPTPSAPSAAQPAPSATPSAPSGAQPAPGATSPAPNAAQPSAPTKLAKADVGARIKTVVPRLGDCYERARRRNPQLGGVINTKLTVHNEPGVRLRVHVDGFDTSGSLGTSREFLACATKVFESAELAPLDTPGSLRLTYPTTFAMQPPDNHDAAIVDQAEQSARDGRWAEALRDAERGLESTSLDGTFRRRLIEVAGLAACHLKHESKARDYYLLAPPRAEATLEQTCKQVANIDLAQ